MQIHVLGSAAGGGFPQWNCNCENCAAVRRGEPGFTARTQSSICVSSDGSNWALINASPDIRAQIGEFPPLQPGRGKRGTGIKAVILMDSQIDHTAGLLLLREGERLPVFATEMVRQDLTTGYPVLRMLESYCGVDWQPVRPDGTPFTVTGVDGLEFSAVGLTSKAPPYSPHRDDPHPGDNIGLVIRDARSGRRVFYAPGLGRIEPHLEPLMAASDCILIDGTFWTEDEMQVRGVGSKTAAQMGHLPQSGDGGMIEQLDRFPDARRILIHINNTNPILDENSEQRVVLASEGLEVAWDGMDIEV
ncbi:MAG TPA: pyrroloquinoline quinone biosynthesis protein PqqB [Arenicellales bacterium]|nr:pyrroloquinoline quinone biosynthesis protein PqqB [Arenicellales bacterium]